MELVLLDSSWKTVLDEWNKKLLQLKEILHGGVMGGVLRIFSGLRDEWWWEYMVVGVDSSGVNSEMELEWIVS